ncbi:hypothetical protein [uncultured Roseobacter sp.]|uniref:hypothetical protein n=1 Tax=uncultured Roseobacter sp. TaxID=114847 RepID=UPI0026102D9F|nr:hypothetical protein [uncultured Roseobacter sp.]
MTVFAEVKVFDPQTDDGTWAAFTDGAITTNEIEHFPASSVPTLFGLEESEFRSRVRRVMSKCVVCNDTCVFWAGEVTSAKLVCRGLLSRNPRTYEDFITTMMSFPETISTRVEIMWVCSNHGLVETFGWRTSAISVSKSVEFMGGGSGWDDLFEIDENSNFGIDIQRLLSGKNLTAIESATIAAASMLDIERHSPERGILDYGGSVDLISYGPNGFARSNFYVLEAVTSKSSPIKSLQPTRIFASYGLDGRSVLLSGNLIGIEEKNHSRFRSVMKSWQNQQIV